MKPPPIWVINRRGIQKGLGDEDAGWAVKGGRNAASVYFREIGTEQADVVKKEILSMGLDDVTGLYEIIWRLEHPLNQSGE